MKEINIVMEAFINLKEIKIPEEWNALEKRRFYTKLRSKAKLTLEAYFARNQTLDDLLRDLSKLDAEARSLNFNYAIDTLNRYQFRT